MTTFRENEINTCQYSNIYGHTPTEGRRQSVRFVYGNIAFYVHSNWMANINLNFKYINLKNNRTSYKPSHGRTIISKSELLKHQISQSSGQRCSAESWYHMKSHVHPRCMMVIGLFDILCYDDKVSTFYWQAIYYKSENTYVRTYFCLGIYTFKRGHNLLEMCTILPKWSQMMLIVYLFQRNDGESSPSILM